jgi:hypothetical protein
MAPVLGDLHRDHGQLLDLPAHRLAHCDTLTDSEHMPTPTALRPILDHLIDRPRRQQRPAPALMPRLGALGTPGRILAPPRQRDRRIGARRLRAITRATIQPALKLRDALILASDTLHELLDLAIHAQQHLDHGLTARIIDRLRLGALHTPRFDEPELCPPWPTERIPN